MISPLFVDLNIKDAPKEALIKFRDARRGT